MVKLIVKPFTKIPLTEEEKSKYPNGMTIPSAKYPFPALYIIKQYRAFFPTLAPKPRAIRSVDKKHQLVLDEFINSLLTVPSTGIENTIYEGTDYKAVYSFYKVARASGYPVVIEGDNEAIRALYGE